MKFSEGDWVKIVEHRFEGALGYIVAIDQYLENFSVRMVRNAQGEEMRIQVSYWYKEHQMVSIEPENTNKDIKRLIDFALDMRDEEWFKELVSQLK